MPLTLNITSPVSAGTSICQPAESVVSRPTSSPLAMATITVPAGAVLPSIDTSPPAPKKVWPGGCCASAAPAISSASSAAPNATIIRGNFDMRSVPFCSCTPQVSTLAAFRTTSLRL